MRGAVLACTHARPGISGSVRIRPWVSTSSRNVSVEQRDSHVLDHTSANPWHLRAEGPCIQSRRQRRSLQGSLRPYQRRTRGLQHVLVVATPPDVELEESVPGEQEDKSVKDQSVKDQEPFLQVPWGAGTIVQVMFFWLLAFWLLGRWVLPLTLQLLGVEQQDLSSRANAFLVLLLDVGEMAATLGVLWVTLRKYRPLPQGWFRTYLWPATWWMGHVALGVALFPLVDLAAARSQVWFPSDTETWGANLVEQSIINGDGITKALYFIVVTACAPLWEESLFRGFLLPSLSKFIPVRLSVLLSSFIFAAAHFSMRHFLPLMLLGIILGTLHIRTRNLMPCISLHSLWNAYIFFQLTRRASGTA